MHQQLDPGPQLKQAIFGAPHEINRRRITSIDRQFNKLKKINDNKTSKEIVEFSPNEESCQGSPNNLKSVSAVDSSLRRGDSARLRRLLGKNSWKKV